jgi:dTMP kinase
MGVLANFVVFEGCDGSGTSTQLELLRRRFEAGEEKMPPLCCTFEPTDGHCGQLLRRALRGELGLHRETMARLFSADRAEHLYGENGLAVRAQAGCLVVCDRYTLSSQVYQGLECGEELPRLLNEAFPAPELLLFFDIEPALAQKRVEGRGQKEIYEYLDFQIRVRARYRSLLGSCRARGSRVEVIDAAKSMEEVAHDVWSAVKKMPIFKR